MVVPNSIEALNVVQENHCDLIVADGNTCDRADQLYIHHPASHQLSIHDDHYITAMEFIEAGFYDFYADAFSKDCDIQDWGSYFQSKLITN